MEKHDLGLEGKDTKSIDQKAPFALGRNYIWGSEACIVVLDNLDVLRRDPSHELALASKFVLQNAQAGTG